VRASGASGDSCAAPPFDTKTFEPIFLLEDGLVGTTAVQNDFSRKYAPQGCVTLMANLIRSMTTLAWYATSNSTEAGPEFPGTVSLTPPSPGSITFKPSTLNE